MTRMMMAAGASEDADATAAMAAFTTAPTTGRRELIDQLIAGLKADGVWSTLDWLVLLAAETEQAGRVNLKNPAKTLTAVNSPTFTADRGWQGNGAAQNSPTGSYLTLGEPFAFSGAQHTTSSAMVGATRNIVGTANRPVFGVDGAFAFHYYPNGTTHSGRAYSDPSTVGTATEAAPRHFVIGLLGEAVASFYNGVPLASSTRASVRAPSGNGCILRSGTVGSQEYSSARVSAFHSGANLTDAQVAALYARLNTYLTAIGAA